MEVLAVQDMADMDRTMLLMILASALAGLLYCCCEFVTGAGEGRAAAGALAWAGTWWLACAELGWPGNTAFVVGSLVCAVVVLAGRMLGFR